MGIGVKIPRKKGEVVRQFLLKKHLLDLSRIIAREGPYLYLPTYDIPATIAQVLQEEFDAQIISFNFTKQQKAKTYQELLEDILPEGKVSEAPQGYDRVGDIAIIEIKESLTNYEIEIGTALLTVNPSIKTVYVKDGNVSGIQRIQKLRFLAGDETYRTIHLEHGVRLCVDLGKAYFSPRLAQEHHRVATQVQPNEVVLDMFTGVGSFAIHIAKRVIGETYAIDINPNAIACLQESIKLNKLQGNITPIIGNVQDVIKNKLIRSCDRVIMNLPGDALSYLESAISAIKLKGGIIHYYTFETAPHPEEVAKSIFLKQIKSAITKILQVQKIKAIAPNTYQVVVDAFIRPNVN